MSSRALSKSSTPQRFLLDDILNTLEVEDSVALPRKYINEPITVRRAVDGTTSYEIIKRERRWRSTVKKGLATIHAFLVEDQLHPAEALRRQLLENIARKDLEPLEIADAIGDFVTRSGRRKPMAQKVATSTGTTSARVSRYRALAGLVTPVRAELAEQLISYGVALGLATVRPEQQAKALALVRNQKLR